MLIRFTVEGTPVPQARPRFTRRLGFTTAYDTKVCRNYKKYVRMVALEEAEKAGWISKELPLRMSVTACFEPPKTWSKKKKAAAIAGEIPFVTKPDVDNLGKIIMDALSDKTSPQRTDPINVDAGLYHDDKQITLLVVRKKYREKACVEVVIETLEQNKQEE